MVKIASLEDVAIGSEVLLREEHLSLENRVRYCNIGHFNKEFARRAYGDVYSSRRAFVDAVKLFRLPKETIICGGGDYVLRCADAFVKEQFSSDLDLSDTNVQAMGTTWSKRPIQGGEYLLVGRFGIYTWGHWLGEILPKVVIVENLFPGRFRYILPRQVLWNDRPEQPWIKIRQSLEAYSVPIESIFGFSGDLDTRFENLYAVGNIWSDALMHPAAADWMRHAVRIDRPPTGIGRLAVARLGGAGRNMDNWPEVESTLAGHGFTTVATGALSFVDQVATFQSAQFVFGTLGSDLVNLIYSPKGVKVITAAPAEFGDRFFYAIVLDREGILADVRGPVTQVDGNMYSMSRFVLGRDDLMDALGVLESEGSGSVRPYRSDGQD